MVTKRELKAKLVTQTVKTQYLERRIEKLEKELRLKDGIIRMLTDCLKVDTKKSPLAATNEQALSKTLIMWIIPHFWEELNEDHIKIFEVAKFQRN